MTTSAFQASTEAHLVLYEAADGVATLTLNRPDRLNTITLELIQQLLAALDQAQADATRLPSAAPGSRAEGIQSVL